MPSVVKPNRQNKHLSIADDYSYYGRPFQISQVYLFILGALFVAPFSNILETFPHGVCLS